MEWKVDNKPKIKPMNNTDSFYSLPSIGKVGYIQKIAGLNRWQIYLFPKLQDGGIYPSSSLHLADVDSREKALIVLETLEFEGQF